MFLIFLLFSVQAWAAPTDICKSVENMQACMADIEPPICYPHCDEENPPCGNCRFGCGTQTPKTLKKKVEECTNGCVCLPGNPNGCPVTPEGVCIPTSGECTVIGCNSKNVWCFEGGIQNLPGTQMPDGSCKCVPPPGCSEDSGAQSCDSDC